LGSKAVEDCIESAISSLTGVKYEANVYYVDFEPNETAYLNDAVEIRVRLKMKDDKD